MQRKRKTLTAWEILGAMFVGGVFALLAGEVGAWTNMPQKASHILAFLAGTNAERLARFVVSKYAFNSFLSVIFPKFGEFLDKQKNEKEKEEDK